MKTVRLQNNVVREIIPDYALPVEKWYGAAFAAECVEAPDEVEQHWIYDPETGIFSEPPIPSEDPDNESPGEFDELWTAMADSIRDGVNAV